MTSLYKIYWNSLVLIWNRLGVTCLFGVLFLAMWTGVFYIRHTSFAFIAEHFRMSFIENAATEIALIFLASCILLLVPIILLAPPVAIFAYYLVSIEKDKASFAGFLTMLKQKFWRLTKTLIIKYLYMGIGILFFAFLIGMVLSTKVETIFFVVGIIFMLRYFCLEYYVIANGDSFTEAKNKSIKIVYNHKLKILLLYLIALLIVIAIFSRPSLLDFILANHLNFIIFEYLIITPAAIMLMLSQYIFAYKFCIEKEAYLKKQKS